MPQQVIRWGLFPAIHALRSSPMKAVKCVHHRICALAARLSRLRRPRMHRPLVEGGFDNGQRRLTRSRRGRCRLLSTTMVAKRYAARLRWFAISGEDAWLRPLAVATPGAASLKRQQLGDRQRRFLV